ncbi:MAG TPA: antibiotic biosynthesis monooxygenase [Rhizomicrobium sp.]|jgi:heme-degrading monooxygenase HmoA|nr:antibiotic biosynthesis monooxygenase [Rhizomicrobium sp.]
MMQSEIPPGAVAVIFMSKRSDADPQGYAAAADDMRREAERQPGYVGIWSARGEDGVGITVSYWASDEAARGWKANAAHAAIRDQGRAKWYDWYELVVAEVTRGYGWKRA